jgi:serine/threonine protein kinase
VTFEDGKRLSERFQCAWTETSAQYDTNITKAFELMIAEIERVEDPNRLIRTSEFLHIDEVSDATVVPMSPPPMLAPGEHQGSYASLDFGFDIEVKKAENPNRPTENSESPYVDKASDIAEINSVSMAPSPMLPLGVHQNRDARLDFDPGMEATHGSGGYLSAQESPWDIYGSSPPRKSYLSMVQSSARPITRILPSVGSGASVYFSAQSMGHNFNTHRLYTQPEETPVLRSEFKTLVKEKGLILPAEKELNWAGRDASEGGGQHVEFARTDEIPLEVLGLIGASLRAKVEKVRCRRILLARKSMVCGRGLKLADALNEVEHLHRLRHSHIVQLVGSYIQGRTFAILLYPVTEYDLTAFLKSTEDLAERSCHGDRSDDVTERLSSLEDLIQRFGFLERSFGCLVTALEFIHSNTTKHMDIKPPNILIKRLKSESRAYHIYIADFGISRNFSLQGHSQTDGPTPRSPIYCAPEVYRWDSRGRAADVFSMGCVFTEMATILRGKSLDDFADFRYEDDASFHKNLHRVWEWMETVLSPWPAPATSMLHSYYDPDLRGNIQLFKTMMSEHPEKRPAASQLAEFFAKCERCDRGPEPFVVESAE